VAPKHYPVDRLFNKLCDVLDAGHVVDGARVNGLMADAAVLLRFSGYHQEVSSGLPHFGQGGKS
jgi:hypothetical protein